METRLPDERRLLVVDDERIQCVIVARAVATLGYVTDTAATLDEATAQLAARRYDAVVLDLSLGETEGISLLQTLRSVADQAVVVLISRLDDRVRAASLRLAMALGLRVAGALEKPIAPSALRAMLRNGPARPVVETATADQRVTVSELDAAVRDQKITAEFQPKVALVDGTVVGVEALARWHRAGGDIAPDVFIPLAERCGLIVPLTFCILRQALAACQRWRSAYPRCSVAVNISTLVLADTTLPEYIERLLQQNGLGPGALIAEITESTVIGQPLVAAEVLTRLRIKGVSLSIDDFGTGHSSLMTLHRLPYSELKIDRSFVTHCDSDPDALKIVRATISMARELGLVVVAEGIETEPVELLLREAGCTIGQGWRFGRAMTEASLNVWLAERERVAA